MPQRMAHKTSKRPALRGKGDYTMEVKSIKAPINRLEAKIDHLERALYPPMLSRKTAASSIGRTLGNFVNQGDIGAHLGSSLASYFGHGDYKIVSNSLMAGKENSTGAKFSGDGKRGTRLKEREFLGNVLSSNSITGSSTDFSLAQYPMNPTNSATFPWLSTIANLFDQWEPHGIVFEFVSTSSEYAATTALGAIIMATDYDPYDTSYTNKVQMENSDYACSSKPSVNLIHGVECDPKERPTPLLFCSTTNAIPITSTTLGNFQVATQGCPAINLTLGELWISYDITFYKKQLVQSSLLSTPENISTGVPSGLNFWTFPSTTNPVSRNITYGNNIINFNNTAVGIKYLVLYFNSSHNTGSTYSSWGSTNATLTNRTGGGSVVSQSVVTAYVVTTTAANATFFGGSNTTSATYVLSAVQVPNDFTF